MKADEILAALFPQPRWSRTNETVAGFYPADEDAHEFAMGIDHRRAAIAALHGDIGANVGGGEETALV